MKLNKKFLQLLAGLWILMFHLWISVTGSGVEQYVQRIGYVGVDLFFFLAAYTLADQELRYGAFLKDRFLRIYVIFAAFAVIAAVYKGWTWQRLLQVLCFVEFFRCGGGSFLWFVPAVMLFYVLYPLFLKIDSRWKSAAVLILWFALSLLSEQVFGYTDCFIFTNRIPVILLGFHLKSRPLPKWIPFVCLPAGLAALKLWGTLPKLNVPIHDFYYIFAAPAVIGLAGLSAYIPKSKVIALLGSGTLEMYAFSMVFGTALVSSIYSLCGSRLLTDFLTIIAVTAVSVLISGLYKYALKKLITV